MKEEDLICPYCRSNDVTEWGTKLTGNNLYKPVNIYRCCRCGRDFEVRIVKKCGEQIFTYGDNFPVFNKKEEKMEFESGDKVTIRIDTGIFHEGKILYADNRDDVYRVKYNDGFKDIEVIVKGNDLTLLENDDTKPLMHIEESQHIKELLEEERKKFINTEAIPRTNKNNLTDLWIDFWEFLKEEGNKQCKD